MQTLRITAGKMFNRKEKHLPIGSVVAGGKYLPVEAEKSGTMMDD